ncbi:MAG: lytic murein transglycosylase [Caulobacteraceae bacterium]|nr:lytic murein transglycosylase [Caulobacteraceae bacterium]
MKLKLFLIAALGACAHPASSVSTSPEAHAELPPVGASAALVMVSDTGPATPSSPVPYSAISPAGDAGALMAWRQGFIERAVAQGVRRETAERELANITVEADALRLDQAQPEYSTSAGLYIQRDTGEATVNRARAKMAPWMSEIPSRYGVPAEIVVGIWRQESDLGGNPGNYDVVNTLATLSALSQRASPERTAARRRDMEGYLVSALKAIDQGKLTRAELRGSWAGAVGQVQFMPTHILNLAVDGDNDGRIDVRGSSRDALFSAAALLQRDGWRAGEGWHQEVSLPANFDWELVDGPARLPGEWERMGVRRVDGQPWSAKDAQAPAVLILPAGANGPAYLALPNHFVIRRYNGSVTSPHYAMTVGLVADRLMGRPGPSKPWPAETRFRVEDVAAAQRALTAMGFNTNGADGKIGPDTRNAVKAWQRANHIIPDGYLTSALIAQITAQAAGR